MNIKDEAPIILKGDERNTYNPLGLDQLLSNDEQ
jgi:hypothetical protein